MRARRAVVAGALVATAQAAAGGTSSAAGSHDGRPRTGGYPFFTHRLATPNWVSRVC